MWGIVELFKFLHLFLEKIVLFYTYCISETSDHRAKVTDIKP